MSRPRSTVTVPGGVGPMRQFRAWHAAVEYAARCVAGGVHTVLVTIEKDGRSYFMLAEPWEDGARFGGIVFYDSRSSKHPDIPDGYCYTAPECDVQPREALRLSRHIDGLHRALAFSKQDRAPRHSFYCPWRGTDKVTQCGCIESRGLDVTPVHAAGERGRYLPQPPDRGGPAGGPVLPQKSLARLPRWDDVPGRDDT